MEIIIEIKPIAYIKSDFPTKFGIPRQSGLVKELISKIIFEKEFQNSEALRGLENFSYIYLIWEFSGVKGSSFSPTVRPPRLGGNKRMGVFATRSPNRPNHLGLSSVKLISLEHTEKYGTIINVGGSDLMDGTPIYDIKPYIPYADSHPDASNGFAESYIDYGLKVDFNENLLNKIPEEKREALIKVLSQDPRPTYQNDSKRIYGMPFLNFDIKFSVIDDCLKVISVDNSKVLSKKQ